MHTINKLFNCSMKEKNSLSKNKKEQLLVNYKRDRKLGSFKNIKNNYKKPNTTKF